MQLQSSTRAVRSLPVPAAVALVDLSTWQEVARGPAAPLLAGDGVEADGGRDGHDPVLEVGPLDGHDGSDQPFGAVSLDTVWPADAARSEPDHGTVEVGGAREGLLAAVNFTAEPMTLRLPDGLPPWATLVMSTDPDRVTGAADLRRFVLLPSEAVLLLPVGDAGARARAAARDGADPVQVR
jgi:hypothetical protein